MLLRCELAQHAGQFRTSACSSCTYLRDCPPLRYALAQRAGQIWTFAGDSCTYLRDSDFASVSVASDLAIPQLSAGFHGTRITGFTGVPGIASGSMASDKRSPSYLWDL